jgi:hypothetical protein
MSEYAGSTWMEEKALMEAEHSREMKAMQSRLSTAEAERDEAIRQMSLNESDRNNELRALICVVEDERNAAQASLARMRQALETVDKQFGGVILLRDGQIKTTLREFCGITAALKESDG